MQGETAMTRTCLAGALAFALIAAPAFAATTPNPPTAPNKAAAQSDKPLCSTLKAKEAADNVGKSNVTNKLYKPDDCIPDAAADAKLSPPSEKMTGKPTGNSSAAASADAKTATAEGSADASATPKMTQK
jgi:hypothetical protein